ncbi:PREDICTED: uncharacterized protein LOC101305796 [Fragaria vesca subsp. vesca]
MKLMRASMRLNGSTFHLQMSSLMMKPGSAILIASIQSRQKISTKHRAKPQLRSTFSASNLLKGREVLNHITGLCTDMKNFAKRGSRKKISENRGLKEKVRDRMPLIVREG